MAPRTLQQIARIAFTNCEYRRRTRLSTFHRISADYSHGYFTVNHLHYVSADTHIRDGVARLVCPNVEEAGTPGLDSLFDKPMLPARQHSVSHRPSGATTRRRSSCRIFAVVKDHARMQRGRGRNRFTADKVEKAI